MHQECNWTCVLVADAGHLLVQQQPECVYPLISFRPLSTILMRASYQVLIFVRKFVFSDNTTGLVSNTSGMLSIVGSEVTVVAAPVLLSQTCILESNLYSSVVMEYTLIYLSHC